MTITITQKDILDNVGTKNLFENKNYVLNEETDIIMNGHFDMDVLFDFHDYLKLKSYFINSITAPECETLSRDFFCRTRMVKKIIVREGTKKLHIKAFAGCDIETLILPQSFENLTKLTFNKSLVRHIEFSGESKTENPKWIIKEDGLHNKQNDYCYLPVCKFPVSKMPYLTPVAGNYLWDKDFYFIKNSSQENKDNLINTWRKPIDDLKARCVALVEKNTEALDLELICKLCNDSPYSKCCIDSEYEYLDKIISGFYRRNESYVQELRAIFETNAKLPKSYKDYFLYYRPNSDPRDWFMCIIFTAGIEIYNIYYGVYAFIGKNEVNAFPQFMCELTDMFPYKPMIVPIYNEEGDKIGEQEFHGQKL